MLFARKAGKLVYETGKGVHYLPHIPIISVEVDILPIGRHNFFVKKSISYRIFIVVEWEIMVECG